MADEPAPSLDIRLANSVLGIASKVVFYIIILLFILISILMLYWHFTACGSP